MNGIYFETFAAAVDAIFTAAYANKCEFAKPTEVWNLTQEPLNYLQTRTGDFALASRKGKPTRAYFHASIYRMDSGRYELTTYIL